MSFEIGKNDLKKLTEIFSTCVLIHLIVAIVICIITEGIGLWLIYNKLVIPATRLNAALWVFHLGVLSIAFSIITIPYTASIISHEKMGIFALMSIINAVLKLIIVFLLTITTFDKLKYYAFFGLIVSIITFLVYLIYCKIRFPESKIIKQYDRKLTKSITAFASWNLVGQLAYILFSQGIDILLNVFFGPVINAARAISIQVQGAIGQLSNNFQSALNPQITKSYAIGDKERMFSLMFASTKISFFLLLIVLLPISLETKTILKAWLKNVPEYAVIFTQISIWITLIDGISNPLMTVAAATGRIKLYQIIVGGILLAIVPISYVALSMGMPPYSVFAIHLILCAVSYFARLVIVKSLTRLSVKKYLKEVVSRCFLTALIAFSCSYPLKRFTPNDNWVIDIIIIIASIIFTFFAAITIGVTHEERQFVLKALKSRIKVFAKT